MKKSVFVGVLVLLVIFIAGCTGVPQGETPGDTAAALRAVQTGTQGIVTQVLENSPPALIYDSSELVALVEVRNRGNYDLDQTSCFVQITGFDPNIIRISAYG
mgnify:FL=1